MARKFLYIVAGLIVLVLAGLFALRIWGTELSRIAFVPGKEFKRPAPVAANAYVDKAMWIARPDLPGNPGMWTPKGLEEDADQPGYATFFIHPTSLYSRSEWNASLDDKATNDRAALFVRGQASVFNKSPALWAPRYRQATLGAFLTDKPEGKQALDAAYADVAQAFEIFLQQADKRPIILAGHSQGALHLTRLLKEKVAGQPIAKRIIAAYVVGWPVSIEADLLALGLPACNRADDTGCILSWQAFAEPADTKPIVEAFEASPGLTGVSRKGSTMLCTNPVKGTIGGDTKAEDNAGTLKNAADFSGGELIKGLVPARCLSGFLMIGDGPDLGPYVMPGNNYHVYDYSLFWRNIRADVERRARAFR